MTRPDCKCWRVRNGKNLTPNGHTAPCNLENVFAAACRLRDATQPDAEVPLDEQEVVFLELCNAVDDARMVETEQA